MQDISYFDIEVLRGLAKNDLQLKPTAQYLHCHRNTITYHIQNIKKVTGLNPRNFYDMCKLLFMYGVIGFDSSVGLVINDDNKEIQ